LTLSNISVLPSEQVELSQLNGRVLAEDAFAMVNSPSADVSLKDGYAIKSEDIADASLKNPIHLKLIGNVAAGEHWDGEIETGTAVRILSGAPIPSGAEAVVSEEFADEQGNRVVITADAEPGRNILPKGTDVRQGERLLAAGDVLMPARIGLLASAGHTSAPVIRQSRVAIIATGDEVLAPGAPLIDGKLFASNMVTLAAWCNYYGMKVTTSVVADNPSTIEEKLLRHLPNQDALITTGGAWSGDRDFIIKLLDKLGWRKVYHRVRIGPGKAIGFGLLARKPVFCLPGGPPSNYVAFLQLALPGLQKYAGYKNPGLNSIVAELSEDVHGMTNWTQFKFGLFELFDGLTRFLPIKGLSRLQDMARAEGVLMIPEGVDHIRAGEIIRVQMLAWPLLHM
jgi:molybdopterin molybdotransferase